MALAACDIGRPVVRTGDELLGLSATLLSQGTSQLIAPVVSVLDVETAPFMVAFHRLLAAGQPPAVALAAAQQDVAGRHPTGLAEVAPLVCLGAGFTSPTPPRGPVDPGPPRHHVVYSHQWSMPPRPSPPSTRREPARSAPACSSKQAPLQT